MNASAMKTGSKPNVMESFDCHGWNEGLAENGKSCGPEADIGAALRQHCRRRPGRGLHRTRSSRSCQRQPCPASTRADARGCSIFRCRSMKSRNARSRCDSCACRRNVALTCSDGLSSVGQHPHQPFRPDIVLPHDIRQDAESDAADHQLARHTDVIDGDAAGYVDHFRTVAAAKIPHTLGALMLGHDAIEPPRNRRRSSVLPLRWRNDRLA